MTRQGQNVYNKGQKPSISFDTACQNIQVEIFIKSLWLIHLSGETQVFSIEKRS